MQVMGKAAARSLGQKAVDSATRTRILDDAMQTEDMDNERLLHAIKERLTRCCLPITSRRSRSVTVNLGVATYAVLSTTETMGTTYTTLLFGFGRNQALSRPQLA